MWNAEIGEGMGEGHVTGGGGGSGGGVDEASSQ